MLAIPMTESEATHLNAGYGKIASITEEFIVFVSLSLRIITVRTPGHGQQCGDCREEGM